MLAAKVQAFPLRTGDVVDSVLMPVMAVDVAKASVVVIVLLLICEMLHCICALKSCTIFSSSSLYDFLSVGGGYTLECTTTSHQPANKRLALSYVLLLLMLQQGIIAILLQENEQIYGELHAIVVAGVCCVFGATPARMLASLQFAHLTCSAW